MGKGRTLCGRHARAAFQVARSKVNQGITFNLSVEQRKIPCGENCDVSELHLTLSICWKQGMDDRKDCNLNNITGELAETNLLAC